MLRSAVAEANSEMVIMPVLMKGGDSGENGRDGAEDSAAYLFELLVAARRLAVTRRHRFLAYLIGMAAEEARLLTQGRSSVRQKAV